MLAEGDNLFDAPDVEHVTEVHGKVLVTAYSSITHDRDATSRFVGRRGITIERYAT